MTEYSLLNYSKSVSRENMKWEENNCYDFQRYELHGVINHSNNLWFSPCNSYLYSELSTRKLDSFSEKLIDKLLASTIRANNTYILTVILTTDHSIILRSNPLFLYPNKPRSFNNYVTIKVSETN